MPRRPPTACRRWSPPAPRRAIVGPKGKRDVPVEKIGDRPGQDLAGQGRDRRIDPAAQAPAAFGRCLSALHSAHRDGYRRGRRRRQPDARCQGRLHGGARVRWARSPPRVLLVKEAAKALIGTKVDDAALDKLAAACFGRLPADRRQARHQGIPYQGRRRARAPRRRNRTEARKGQVMDQDSAFRPRSTAMPSSISARPTRRCSTCCATGSA